MAGLSDFAENLYLDHILGNSESPPEARYLALYIAAPSDAGGGTEVSGNGYARQLVEFDAAASGAAANSNVPQFAASGGAWGTVTHFGVFDASSGGNLMFWAPLATSRVVNNGDTLEFAAGDIDVTLD